jgi:hypothetical protein
MVKVTGRTRDGVHLKAHLDYIARHGDLELETSDGWALHGKDGVRELAEDWAAFAAQDSRRRANTPISLSVVLSMPKGSDPLVVRDAARGFAQAVFDERFDYAFALHTDAQHPHGRAVEAFVRQMPAPDTQRLALARALREANARSRREERGDPGAGRDRSR